MYTYYCRDEKCRGHAKSWERCDHVRTFNPKAAGGFTWAGGLSSASLAESARRVRRRAPKMIG